MLSLWHKSHPTEKLLLGYLSFFNLLIQFITRKYPTYKRSSIWTYFFFWVLRETKVIKLLGILKRKKQEGKKKRKRKETMSVKSDSESNYYQSITAIRHEDETWNGLYEHSVDTRLRTSQDLIGYMAIWHKSALNIDAAIYFSNFF